MELNRHLCWGLFFFFFFFFFQFVKREKRKEKREKSIYRYFLLSWLQVPHWRNRIQWLWLSNLFRENQRQMSVLIWDFFFLWFLLFYCVYCVCFVVLLFFVVFCDFYCFIVFSVLFFVVFCCFLLCLFLFL